MDPIKRGKKSGLFRKRSLAKIAKIDKLLQAENQPVPSTSGETQDMDSQRSSAPAKKTSTTCSNNENTVAAFQLPVASKPQPCSSNPVLPVLPTLSVIPSCKTRPPKTPKLHITFPNSSPDPTKPRKPLPVHPYLKPVAPKPQLPTLLSSSIPSENKKFLPVRTNSDTRPPMPPKMCPTCLQPTSSTILPMPSGTLQTPSPTEYPNLASSKDMEIMAATLADISSKVDIMYNAMHHKYATEREANIQKITTPEGLIRFEEMLKADSMYMVDVIQKVLFAIQFIKDIEGRLNAALNILVDRNVLKLCSWTERGSSGTTKIEFAQLTATLRLFRFLGCNETLEATDELVKHFLMKKLHNATSSCQTKKRRKSS